MSSTTMPKVSACSTSVNALTVCSTARWFRSRHMPGLMTTCPRIQSRRSKSIPAADAEETSSMSSASTSATNSPRAIAAFNSCRSTLVRPDERGPTSSDTWPRGNPPPNRASMSPRFVAATASSSDCTWPGDHAGVSVRSSLRVRSSASSSARARDAMFRLMFAF